MIPRWLREHWPLKIGALFLSLVLWLVVSARKPTEEVVPVRFAPQLDSSLRLVSQPPALRALVVGQGRELLELYSEPPVFRPVVPVDVGDTISIPVTVDEIVMPPGVEVLVRDVQPRTVVLRFATTAQRFVPVRSGLTLSPDASIRISGSPGFEPESVLVTGPRRAVAKVDSVMTVRETRAVCDDGPFLVALDTAGIGARVRPAQVSARIPVQRDAAIELGEACRPAERVRRGARGARGGGRGGR